MCTFGLSGCRVNPWRLWGRRGFTRQPENSKRAHFRSPALQTPPKFHEKTPRERDKKNEMGAEEGKKKSAKLWAPPPFGAPPFGAPLFLGLPPSLPRPHPQPPPPRGPTMTHTRSKNGLAQIGLAEIGFGQNWFWPKLAGPKPRWPKMDWPRLVDWPKLVKSGWPKQNWPKSAPSHRSHLIVLTPVSQICRTSVSLWDLLNSWWNAHYLSSSSPWIQMLAVLKTWTFSISQNALHCLLLHPSRIDNGWSGSVPSRAWR